jgi:hypothetical protein
MRNQMNKNFLKICRTNKNLTVIFDEEMFMCMEDVDVLEKSYTWRVKIKNNSFPDIAFNITDAYSYINELLYREYQILDDYNINVLYKVVLNCNGNVFYKRVAYEMKRAEKKIRRRRKHNIKKILDIIFFNDISYDIIQYI